MNSILKLLEYIRKVSKVPIECDGENLSTPEKISINPSFYKKDDCRVCGICCSASFNTVYTESGIEWIDNCPQSEFENKDMYGDHPIPLENRKLLRDSIISHEYEVNGNKVKIYESPCLPPKQANNIELPHKPSASARCRWMITDVPGLYRCGIHPIRSVTCGLPHCRFNFNNQSRHTSIGIGQYGRNWALGCPIDLKDAPFSLSSTLTRLYWMKVLLQCAEDLKIPTVLPEIIAYHDSIMDDMKKGNFPEQPISFSSDGTLISGPLVNNSVRSRKLFDVRGSR